MIMDKDKILRTENLTMGYGKRMLLQDVSVTVSRGSLVALIGRNGAGKSTLLRTLVGLVNPLSGKVFVDNKPLSKFEPTLRAKKVAFVAAGGRMSIPGMTVRDIVSLGRAPYTDWIGRLNSDDKLIVDEAIQSVGLQGFADREYDSLSDGEAQRVNIARALAQQTAFMLLDEPTSFLDLPARYDLCMTLRRLAHERNVGVLFSIHDLDIALQFSDQLLIVEGSGLACGTPDALIEDGVFSRIFDSDHLVFDTALRRLRPRQ